MYALEYTRPGTLSAARDFLVANPDAKLLAGGMTLIPTLKQRLAQPSHLVDIAGLPELRGIGIKGGELWIGAAMKHREVASSQAVGRAIPALAELAGLIGDPQVRNQGTLGGSVANNDPSADYPAAVLALDAVVVTDRREIAAEGFFRGMFATALEPGEIIVRLKFPVPRRAAYAKFPHPASGYAMAGVFVAGTKDGVRVAVTGAGPGVFRWNEAEAALGKEMSAAALDGTTPDPEGLNEDIHATREYRAQLVKAMARRAVAKISGR